MIKVNCSYKRLVKVSELKPHPKNPNKHPDNQIDAFEILLKQHGWRLPICVSVQSGFIVRGHLRYYTALKMGETKVPVDFQEYESEAMELADLTADNRIPEMAKIDDQLLNELLTQIKKTPEVDIQVTGYTDRDLEKLNKKLKKGKARPEVEFTEELHESSNYIVLYFDNDIDWLQALTMFGLKTVKALDSRPGFEKQGIGRVLNGADALNRIVGE